MISADYDREKGEVTIVWTTGDEQALNKAARLAQILKVGGWTDEEPEIDATEGEITIRFYLQPKLQERNGILAQIDELSAHNLTLEA